MLVSMAIQCLEILEPYSLDMDVPHILSSLVYGLAVVREIPFLPYITSYFYGKRVIISYISNGSKVLL